MADKSKNRATRHGDSRHQPQPSTRRTEVGTTGGPTAEGDGSVFSAPSGLFAPSVWLWPPQCPIDENFRPYYERVRSGEVEALLEFYQRRGHQLSPAFYQCLGVLATSPLPREKKVVERIMKITGRGGPPETRPAKLDRVWNWVNRLRPIAGEAKKWIGEQRRLARKEGGSHLTREVLWKSYLSEKVGSEALDRIPGLLTEFGVDWAVAMEQEPRRHIAQLRRGQARLLADHSSASARSVGAIFQGMTRKELRDKPRTIHRFVTERYLEQGVVPRSLFFDLAQSSPNIAPSTAARRLACKIVGISESAASRK